MRTINPVTNIDAYGGEATYKTAPTGTDLTGGVEPAETLPAQWWNWLWNQIIDQERNTVTALDSIFAELTNTITDGGLTPSETATNQLATAIANIRKRIATTTVPGALLASSDNGKVSVAANGVMTANGLGDIAAYKDASTTVYLWDWRVSGRYSFSIQSTTGTVNPYVDGTESTEQVLNVDATTGKFASNTSGYVQMNAGTILSFPVTKGDVVHIQAYPGQAKYSINGTAYTADSVDYACTESGTLRIVATGNGYLYYIQWAHTVSAYNTVVDALNSLYTRLNAEITTRTNQIAALTNTANSLTTTAQGKAPTNHASADTTYGAATGALYGHVKVSTGNGLNISNGVLSMLLASISQPGALTAADYASLIRNTAWMNQFTFIVTDGNDFAAWTAGTLGDDDDNDYSYVLILPGTYTLTTNVNLETIGTKGIWAMPGTVTITGDYVISRSTSVAEDTIDTRLFIHGIIFTGGARLFYCLNITDCSFTVASSAAYGCSRCHTILRCTFQCTTGTWVGMGVILSFYISDCSFQNLDKGIDSCQHITDCCISACRYGIRGSYHIFNNRFINCAISIYSAGYIYNNDISSMWAGGVAIDTSNHIMNNTISMSGASGNGVVNCISVVNNTAAASDGSCYSGCKGMQNNTHVGSTGYTSCYADTEGSIDVADTATSGYNS